MTFRPVIGIFFFFNDLFLCDLVMLLYSINAIKNIGTLSEMQIFADILFGKSSRQYVFKNFHVCYELLTRVHLRSNIYFCLYYVFLLYIFVIISCYCYSYY